jgi:hypothetical protein
MIARQADGRPGASSDMSKHDLTKQLASHGGALIREHAVRVQSIVESLADVRGATPTSTGAHQRCSDVKWKEVPYFEAGKICFPARNT